MEKLTLIFINFRFAKFYSENIIEKIKQYYEVRVVGIVDDFFINHVPDFIRKNLDEFYHAKSQAKNNFLPMFQYNALKTIIEKERRMYPERNIRLICSDEFNLMQAGRLRENFNIYGHHRAILEKFRDKMLMKKIVKNAKLRTPHFRAIQKKDLVRNSLTYQHLCKKMSDDFIIKPIDSCGSEGVFHIQSYQDYCAFLKKNIHKAAALEAEEYIKGTLYHVDVISDEKNIVFCEANQYSVPNLELTQGKTLASIPVAEPILKNRLEVFAKKIIRAFGVKNMVNHIEIFVKNNAEKELVFLEISARPPGGFINLAHRYNFGVNLMDWDLRLQGGLSIPLEKEKTTPTFWAYFPLKEGVVKKIHCPKISSQHDIHWHVNPGDKTKLSKDVVKTAGYIIAHNKNNEVLYRDFDYISHFDPLEMV